MLVKRESTSRLTIKNSLSFSMISSVKANNSLSVYSVLVKGFNICTRKFGNL